MATTAPTDSNRAVDIQYYFNLLNQQYPGNLSGRNYSIAQQYARFLQQHPTADPAYTYEQVIAEFEVIQNIPQSLGQDIGSSLQKTGQVSQSIGPAAGAAAQNLQIPGLSGIDAIGNFFNKLGQKNTWLRIGEGIVAIVLLDVGLKALTGHSVIESTGKTITGGSKKAAKVAMFA